MIEGFLWGIRPVFFKIKDPWLDQIPFNLLASSLFPDHKAPRKTTIQKKHPNRIFMYFLYLFLLLYQKNRFRKKADWEILQEKIFQKNDSKRCAFWSVFFLYSICCFWLRYKCYHLRCSLGENRQKSCEDFRCPEKAPRKHFNFVHGTALKMYIKDFWGEKTRSTSLSKWGEKGCDG